MYAQVLSLLAPGTPPEVTSEIDHLLVILSSKFLPEDLIASAVRAYLARKATSQDAKTAERMSFQYIRFRGLTRGDPSPYANVPLLNLLSNWITSTMVFHVPLYEAMWTQRKRYPSLPVPAVLLQLEAKLEQSGGFRTEGTFRLSGDMALVARLAEEANQGNAQFLASARVHDIASLYKFWFRQVPGHLVDEATTRALLTQDNFIQIADDVPVPQRNVLKHLIGFLKRFATFEETTRMYATNLAIVFA
jgi:hypothetical protein